MTTRVWLLAPLLAGCAHHAPTSQVGRDPALAGYWMDPETSTTYEIRFGPDGAACVAAVDDNGEVFEVTGNANSGSAFSWDVHVPATGYDVTYTVVAVDDDRLETLWSGTAGSGKEVLSRTYGVPDGVGYGEIGGVGFGAGPVDLAALAGTWQDDETLTLYTILTPNGVPTLVSAVDDDGEVFAIQGMTWADGQFGWSVRVPTTGYDLHYDVLSVSDETMEARWYGTGGEGIETLHKVR